nr:UL20 [Suid alphaherpesvirus 1]
MEDAAAVDVDAASDATTTAAVGEKDALLSSAFVGARPPRPRFSSHVVSLLVLALALRPACCLVLALHGSRATLAVLLTALAFYARAAVCAALVARNVARDRMPLSPAQQVALGLLAAARLAFLYVALDAGRHYAPALAGALYGADCVCDALAFLLPRAYARSIMH